jgi:hypothetical protein
MFPGMLHPQIARITIEGIDFTLYFDYDQLRDSKLSRLTDPGRIEWFRCRMEFVFLEPLASLYAGKTPAYRALNSMDQEDLPARSFVIAAFSILLNGIEALGSFITTRPEDDKRANFFAFMTTYMKPWNKHIPNSPYAPLGDMKAILWEHFRNGIAHGFCIERGGIDNEADGPRWIVGPNSLHIGPNTFFQDFRLGLDSFFADLNSDPGRSSTFLARFRQLYPH